MDQLDRQARGTDLPSAMRSAVSSSTKVHVTLPKLPANREKEDRALQVMSLLTARQVANKANKYSLEPYPWREEARRVKDPLKLQMQEPPGNNPASSSVSSISTF